MSLSSPASSLPAAAESPASAALASLSRVLMGLLLRGEQLDETEHPDVDSDLAMHALAELADDVKLACEEARQQHGLTAAAVAPMRDSALAELQRLIRLHQQAGEERRRGAAALQRESGDRSS
jgi:hypothetical protein